ncbi:MAG: hypothetical protein GX851_03980, partial [Clostridiales bacterium]|nr:hypothetical protein [Clostridiales bacterium]
HWLIDPVSRLTDAISFGSSSFLWANENTNSYEFSLLYDETVTYYNQNGTVTNEVTTEVEEYTERDPEIHENGFFYTFNLPNNLPRTFDSSSSTKRSDFSAVICGTCEPKAAPVSSTAYMLVLTYVHIQFTVNAGLSFGWSSGDGFGVSISASLGTIEKNYTHYFGWRYYELFA